MFASRFHIKKNRSFTKSHRRRHNTLILINIVKMTLRGLNSDFASSQSCCARVAPALAQGLIRFCRHRYAVDQVFSSVAMRSGLARSWYSDQQGDYERNWLAEIEA